MLRRQDDCTQFRTTPAVDRWTAVGSCVNTMCRAKWSLHDPAVIELPASQTLLDSGTAACCGSVVIYTLLYVFRIAQIMNVPVTWEAELANKDTCTAAPPSAGFLSV